PKPCEWFLERAGRKTDAAPTALVAKDGGVPCQRHIPRWFARPSTRRWWVGAAWLGFACGLCPFCRRGEENLCPNAQFHGWTRDGGFSEAMIADGRFLFALPDGPDDMHFAPLLCAGLIGYRALRMAEDAERVGLYGLGAAAH